MERQEKIRILRRQVELHPDSELAKSALEQELGLKSYADTRPAPANYRHELPYFRFIVRIFAILMFGAASLILASALLGGASFVGAIILFAFSGVFWRFSTL